MKTNLFKEASEAPALRNMLPVQIMIFFAEIAILSSMVSHSNIWKGRNLGLRCCPNKFPNSPSCPVLPFCTLDSAKEFWYELFLERPSAWRRQLERKLLQRQTLRSQCFFNSRPPITLFWFNVPGRNLYYTFFFMSVISSAPSFQFASDVLRCRTLGGWTSNF